MALRPCFDLNEGESYHCAAMIGPLNGWYDYDQLGHQRARFEGELNVASSDRLHDLVGDGSRVTAQIQFDSHPSGAVLVDLSLEGALRLICQRCLEQMTFGLDVTVGLALVESEAGASLAPPGYEPVVLAEKRASPAVLAEDEIIMALPMVPKHAVDELGVCVA